MKKPPKVKAKPAESFKALQAKWYKKLEKSGFEDIEQDENNLKTWTSRVFRHLGKDPGAGRRWQAQAEYFQLATNFLNEYKFDSNLEKVIWEYHANGLRIREIEETLKKARIRKVKRTKIWETIRRLKARMYDMYLADKVAAHE